MGKKGNGKKPKWSNKAKAATDGNYEMGSDNAVKRALKATKRAITNRFVPQTAHHCPECYGAYNNATCTAKGHKLNCPIHDKLYFRKSKCVKCVVEQKRKNDAEWQEYVASKPSLPSPKQEMEEFLNPGPERKKPRGQKL